MQRITVYILFCFIAISFASCTQQQPKHTHTNGHIVYDKKSLECERKNWNRMPKKAGYIQYQLNTQKIVTNK